MRKETISTPVSPTPGDWVEFRSSDRGGCWKLGLAISYGRALNSVERVTCTNNLRILVGQSVCIQRKVTQCRKVNVTNLPITLIPNTYPPRFRWRQVVTTPVGTRIVDHEGTLPPTIESAMLALLTLVRVQAATIEELQSQIKGHCDRIVAQSEIITKKAETPQPSKRGKYS